MSSTVMVNTILKGENISGIGSMDKFENMFRWPEGPGTDTIPA